MQMAQAHLMHNKESEMNHHGFTYTSHFAFLISLFMVAPESQAATSHTVRILNHAFEPATVNVQPGDTVRWLHQDGAAHTSTGNGTEIWNSDQMEFGDVYLRVFINPGSHDYVCLYHPMFGKVVVGGSTALTPQSRSLPETIGEFGGGTGQNPRDVLGRKATPEPSPYEAVIRAKPQ